MQKRFKYVMLLLLLLPACQKEDAPEPKEPSGFSMKAVKRFFEGFEEPIQFGGAPGSRAEQQADIFPFWESGKEFPFMGVPVVEVPLNTTNVAYRQWFGEGPAPEQGAHPQNAVMKLVAVEFEGEILYAVATIVASDWYLENVSGSAERLSLGALDDFTGQVVYYTLRGETFGLVRYVEGRAVEVGTPAEPPTDYRWPLIPEVAPLSRAVMCVWTMEMTTFCTLTASVNSDGAIIGINHIECGAPHLSHYSEDCHHFQLPYDGGGGGPGGPGGGGGGVTPPLPPLTPQDIAPEATEIFSDSSDVDIEQWVLLNHMVKRLEEDCLTNYLFDNYVKGQNIHLEIFASSPSGSAGRYNELNNRISLYNFDRSRNIFTLFHELFHAAQSQYYIGGLNQFSNRKANIEMEAYMATGLYESRTQGRPNSRISDNMAINRAYWDRLSLLSPYGANHVDAASLNMLYHDYLDDYAAWRNEPVDFDMSTIFLQHIYANSGCN